MYFEIFDYNTLKSALHNLCRGLREFNVPQDAVCDSKLVADELVSNALQHGGGKAYLTVEVTEDLISLRVKGAYAFSPPDETMMVKVDAERGRGLYIIDALVETRESSFDGGTFVTIRFER